MQQTVYLRYVMSKRLLQHIRVHQISLTPALAHTEGQTQKDMTACPMARKCQKHTYAHTEHIHACTRARMHPCMHKRRRHAQAIRLMAARAAAPTPYFGLPNPAHDRVLVTWQRPKTPFAIAQPMALSGLVTTAYRSHTTPRSRSTALAGTRDRPRAHHLSLSPAVHEPPPGWRGLRGQVAQSCRGS